MTLVANFEADGMRLIAVGRDHSIEGRNIVRVDGIFSRYGVPMERLSEDVMVSAEMALDAEFLAEVSFHGEKER